MGAGSGGLTRGGATLPSMKLSGEKPLDNPLESVVEALPLDGITLSPPVEEVRKRTAKALQFIDEVGSWNIASSLTILGIFVLESYTQADLTEMMANGYMPMDLNISLSDLALIEGIINAILFLECGIRFFASGFSVKYLLSPLALVDLVCVVPLYLTWAGFTGPILQYARTLRILRLLRLIGTNTGNRFFLLKNAGEVTVKLYEILVEFFTIFFFTSAVIFNIEHPTNEEFGDLGDSLYWAFLTLTGNEQPFDVITAQGRITAVLSYTIAIAVVPGQLARVLATLGDQMMNDMDGRMPNEGRPNGTTSNARNQTKSLLTSILSYGSYKNNKSGNAKPRARPPVAAMLAERNGEANIGAGQWGNEEVVAWLYRVKMERYKKAFVAARVDGPMLLDYVDKEALELDFGVELRTHRNKLLAEIEALRETAYDYE